MGKIILIITSVIIIVCLTTFLYFREDIRKVKDVELKEEEQFINGEGNTWTVYQDIIEDKKMSVRVDTQYINSSYTNTFYVQVKYGEEEPKELPDGKFIQNLYSLEDKILKEVQGTFGDNIVFLGTATFGGSCYITFASDLDVKWVEFLKAKIDNNILAGVYYNDNMGYYNQILYPDYMRK